MSPRPSDLGFWCRFARVLMIVAASAVWVSMLDGLIPLTRAACSSGLDTQLKKSMEVLKELKDEQLPTLSGSAEVVMGWDAASRKKMNHMGIVAVQVYARERSLLPLDRVQFLDHKMQNAVTLPRIFPLDPVETVDESTPEAKLFGGFKQRSYYFFPERILKQRGKLIVRFQGGNSALPVLEFPKPFGFAPQREQDDVLPDPKITAELLSTKLCFGSG